jgi:hypothetical protein
MEGAQKNGCFSIGTVSFCPARAGIPSGLRVRAVVIPAVIPRVAAVALPGSIGAVGLTELISGAIVVGRGLRILDRFVDSKIMGTGNDTAGNR